MAMLSQAYVCKSVIDAAMAFLGMIEQRDEIRPLRDIGLDEAKSVVFDWWRIDVTRDHGYAELQEKLGCR